MQRQPIYLATAAVITGLPAAASAVEIPPVVVTAQRLPTPADETLAAVTVITREDIEATNPQSISDLLRLQPGIDVVRSGGIGGNTSVFLRGSNSDHVLVLIDGVRAASSASGLFEWRQITPAQIERIEIVRGPRAALYGSDAVGGVIQIFTRQPQGMTASVTAGSRDTQRAEAGIGLGEATRLAVNTSFTRTDGISATNSSNFSHDPDNDGYINRSVNARFTTPLWSDAVLRLSGWHANSDIEFDEGVQDSVNGTYSARLSDRPLAAWNYALTLGYNQDDIETKSAFPSRIETQRTTLDWQNNLDLGARQSLTLGLFWRRDTGKNIDATTSRLIFNDSITNSAAYANWLGTFGRNDFELGVRYNQQSEFGGYPTGQLAWGHRFGAGYRMILSYGSAFKAPNLNELFHPGVGGFFAGNPDLEPERSHSAELAFRYQQPGGRRRVEANLFYTRIEGLIAFAGERSQAINIDKAQIPGLELQYADGIGRWRVDSSLTLQRPRNLTEDTRLLRRPDTKFSLVLARTLGQSGLIRGELLRIGERIDIGGETLGGYTLLNLSGQVHLTQTLSLEGRIENVTDKKYENAFGFNTLGRMFYLSLRYAGG